MLIRRALMVAAAALVAVYLFLGAPGQDPSGPSFDGEMKVVKPEVDHANESAISSEVAAGDVKTVLSGSGWMPIGILVGGDCGDVDILYLDENFDWPGGEVEWPSEIDLDSEAQAECVNDIETTFGKGC